MLLRPGWMWSRCRFPGGQGTTDTSFVRLVHHTPQGSHPPPGAGQCSSPGALEAPTHLPESARHLVEAPAPHPGSPPRGWGAVGRGQEASSHVCRVVWGQAAQGLHPGSRGQLAAGAGSLRGDTHPPRGCCLRWAQLGHLRAPPGDRELWGWAVASRAHAESPLGGEDSLDVEVTGAPLAPTAGKAAQLGWPAGAQAARTEAAFRRAASVRRAEGGQAGPQQTRVYITPFPGWTPRPSYVTPGRASRPHEGFGGPCSDPGGPGPSRWPGLSTPPPFLSPRANFDDTATYSAVATNGYGQVSTNAAVVVRREWSSGGGGRGAPPTAPTPAACAAHPPVPQGSTETRSRSARWDSPLDVSHRSPLAPRTCRGRYFLGVQPFLKSRFQSPCESFLAGRAQ